MEEKLKKINKNKDRCHNDSFFGSIRVLLMFGQICGLMPLKGIYGESHEELTFSWKSLRFIYVLTTLSVATLIDCIATYDSSLDGFHLDNFGITMFYSVCIINIFFFVEFAKKLPKFCQQVCEVEEHLKGYGYPPYTNFRIKSIIYFFFIFASVEHGILTVVNVKTAMRRAEASNVTFLEHFYLLRFPSICAYIDYNSFLTVFLYVINVILTFNWNYLDIFIACLSLALSQKFAQVNKKILSGQDRNHDETYWKSVRIDYNRLSLLTKLLDRNISKFVLVAYVSNLYHLSLQIIRSFKFQGDTYAKIYFYTSMSLLVLRLLTVSLLAANIREESKRSLSTLYTVEAPTVSSQRLLDQILHDDVHLTGRFFIVDKNFIFVMLGTLVTYEVILLQLDSLRHQEDRL